MGKDRRKENQILKRAGLGRKWWTRVNGKKRFPNEDEWQKAVEKYIKENGIKSN